jgi:hypothetical protein
MGDDRIAAEEQQYLGLVDVVRPRAPAALPLEADELGRLVDGVDRIELVRSQRRQEIELDHVRGIERARRTLERRDRFRSVPVNDRAQPVRNLVERLLASDLGESAVVLALERMQQPGRTVMGFFRLQALEADIALTERVALVALDVDDPLATILNIEHHAAMRGADAAEGPCLPGRHDVSPGRFLALVRQSICIGPAIKRQPVTRSARRFLGRPEILEDFFAGKMP